MLPDVFAARPALLGALVGGFLIGRPHPLLNRLFHWAVDTGNPAYGALAFVLLVALGVFTVVYWDLRVPAHFGVGWFPTMPYN